MNRHRSKVCGRALKSLACGLLPVIAAASGARGFEGEIGSSADRPIPREIARWNPQIAEASTRFGIPQSWIRRVMRAESGGRTSVNGSPITSRAGAMGLMQLMPGTWAELRAKHGLGPDPHHPRDNILAGTAYLRAMYDRFGYPGMFAAYNAGPRRFAEHLVTGRPLPAETVAYSAAMGELPSRRSATSRKQSLSGGIFVAIGNARVRDTEAISWRVAPGSLFVRLSAASAASE